ncbi:MAG: DNA repair protein RecO [Chloroflexi bacterium]|nr:DNA repair protein RecO [Chloroflexota bacterium]
MTSRPRFYSAEAVVVRQIDIGEADRLLTLLTPSRGILRATARGARKPGSKIGGHPELLCHVTVALSASRSPLDTVSQAETIDSFRALLADLNLLSRGLYVAELTERFSVEDAPAPAMFRQLVDGLRTLQTAASPDVFLRWYELRLMSINGFLPEFQRCVDCGSDLAPEDHVFSASRGGLVCPKCRGRGDDPLIPATLNAVKVLRFLRRAGWPEAASLRVSDDDHRRVERITRTHLQYVLDRDVKSTAFLDEVRKWSDTGTRDIPV